MYKQYSPTPQSGRNITIFIFLSSTKNIFKSITSQPNSRSVVSQKHNNPHELDFLITTKLKSVIFLK